MTSNPTGDCTVEEMLMAVNSAAICGVTLREILNEKQNALQIPIDLQQKPPDRRTKRSNKSN